MKFISFTQSALESCVITILLVALTTVGWAQVRSSTNYQLQSDSINIGGGYSSSTSYIQESTVGEIGTGESNSTSYSLRAGYQQMQEVFISLAIAGDVVMDTDIYGLTGGISNGSTTAIVITDSPSGYQLTIEAENEPAMKRNGGSETIADYDAGAEPDFIFDIGGTDAHLGFAPQSEDAVQFFLNDTLDCNSGGNSTAQTCWFGLATTSRTISEGSAANHPSGATTTVHFRVGVGSASGVTAGVYTATTTLTALPL